MNLRGPDDDLMLIRQVLASLAGCGSVEWETRASAALGALDRLALSRTNAIATAHRLRRSLQNARGIELVPL